MSMELVSKSLEMEDMALGKKGDTLKGHNKKKKLKTNDAMQVIKTDRHGVWRELRKVRKKQLKEMTKKKKKEVFKSAIELYKDEHDVDYTDSNVETLLKISKLGKVKPNDAQKILYQQPCRLSKFVKEKVEAEAPASIFTDQDFENFAKEYKP